jgi:hypothetical protein
MTKITSTIKFLGKDLELGYTDRTNPMVLMFISMIEMNELYHGDGLIWFGKYKNNYKINFGDNKLGEQIENILISNKNKGVKDDK